MAFDGFSLLFIQTGSKAEKQPCRDFLASQGDGMQVGQQQQPRADGVYLLGATELAGEHAVWDL